MPNLIEIIKKASVEAIESSNPCAVLYGKVKSIEPLKILVDQRLTLDEKQLILTSNVMEHEIEASIDTLTENTSNHTHGIEGRKMITIHNGLGIDDKVILLRLQGGQKFMVMDRVIE